MSNQISKISALSPKSRKALTSPIKLSFCKGKTCFDLILFAFIVLNAKLKLMNMLQEFVSYLNLRFTLLDIVSVFVVLLIAQIIVKIIKKPTGRLFGVARFLIWSIAFVLILSNFGYDVSSLLAGLGIGGIALALAAQETLSNAFASLAILADKPFKIGDTIKVGEHSGKVLSIGVRSTVLLTKDESIVSMPNKLIASLPVENLSKKQS